MAAEAKLRSIKVPDDTWERWQKEAKVLGISVTALIIQRVDRVRASVPIDKSARHPSGPVLSSVVPTNLEGTATPLFKKSAKTKGSQ